MHILDDSLSLNMTYYTGKLQHLHHLQHLQRLLRLQHFSSGRILSPYNFSLFPAISCDFFLFLLLPPMHPIISTYITTHGSIPFIDDLAHISDLSQSEKELILANAIEELAVNDKTKGTQLFTRFFENHNDLFWQFRALNHDIKQTKKPEFHEL